jgi:DNA phosphorothioation system restriction enzyme
MGGLSPPDWIEARPYQRAAVEAWMSSDGQGILNMATGTGKTITSLLAAARLADLQEDRLALVVAAPYQHLVDQWVAELQNFGARPLLAYESRDTWVDPLAGQITEFQTGARDTLAVVTTHRTFSADHFQRLIGRLDGTRTMLIGDEVHHLGAPSIRTALPESIRARMGLSATPERWYDDEGTTALTRYFSNGIVYEYGLGEAIVNGHLSEYYYVPHVVELTADEQEEYLALSKAIGQRASAVEGDVGDADLQADDSLKQLLIKRARLIGTARQKLTVLEELLERSRPIRHTLVYCGDGRVETDGEATKRQLEAVIELMGNDLGLKIHQFTYEEDQEIRERLLGDFESGELEALVAIRCLDEGVDVPATQTAFILASSSNPRQFVQRRGRILRPHPGKDHSTIHDFVVAPPGAVREADDDSVFNLERTLVRKELQRVSTFAESAKNHPDADLGSVPTTPTSLHQLKKEFNLLDV